LTAAVVQAQKQINEIDSKYRSDLRNEAIDAESAHRKLEQEFAKQSHKSDLLQLRAPEPGIVKDLATHTLGTVVSAGTVLLSVVPEDEPLMAEVRIENEDIGFVRPLQPVKLKLAAYPFQKYGMIDGQLVQVWPDASDDSQAPAARQPNTASSSSRDSTQHGAYRALVRLNAQVLESRGESLALVPGMTVIAEIEEGRRSVLEYILSPIRRTLSESGHER
jgi:HlyD family secretion protein